MAPPKSVAALLTCLSCTYWRTPSPKSAGIIDVKRLQTLSETASRSVCGKVFAQGDIVWTCRQCGKDPTCVQCDQCFRKSDHVGHEVYFHRAAGGGSGCCDCGDEEAWCRAGNCLDHNHPSRDHHGPANPLEGVPPELERGFRTVVRGALGVVTSYVICTVRGFAPLEQNTFVEEVRQRKDSIVVRLHNDDVHTYDDVTGALHAFGLTQQAGAQLTAKVDKEGEATILTESNPESSKLSAAQALFVDRVGLLMSMTPQSVVQLEPRVAAVLEWFQSMGALSDGLRRVISEELVAELTSTAQCFPDAAGADAAQVEAVNQKYSASRAFEDATQFPSVMLHLLKLPDSLDLVAPVDVNPQSESEAPLESTALSAPPEPNSEYSEAYAERLRHPFRHCHPDALALLLVASPYLANSLKAAINDLVIQYQHDAVFKATFSQQFTTLYPALCVLYCRGVGTADRTIFHMSVQVYTANSVVTMMSSDGAQPGAALRLLPEGQRPLMALPLLAATLQTALLETGCLTVSASATATAAQRAAFLTNHTIRTHRLSHLCRDVEYLSADPGFCTRLLAEDVDKGLIDIWVTISTMLQNIDSYTRKTDTHVEREDERWQDAANLVIEIDGVATTIIARGLLDQAFAEERKAVAARSGASRGASTSSATPYVAPIAGRRSPAEIAAMRESAVSLCTRKVLAAVCQWADTFAGDSVAGGVCSAPLPYPCGGDNVHLFTLVNLPVNAPFSGTSSLPISVHLPLHRLLSKLVTHAAHGGVDLQRALGPVKGLSELQAVRCLEHPLRCLSFAAQVHCGMWRRNGYTAANLAYNYNRAPLCRSLRDMDIVTVQLMTLALGGNAVLGTLINRFELTDYKMACGGALASLQRRLLAMPQLGTVDIREYLPALLSELLKLLILTTTYLPVCLLEELDGVETEGWSRVLRREVMHHILGGATAIGQLQKCKIMVGSSRTVSDAMLLETVEALCAPRRDDDDETSRALALKPSAYAFFDPEFPNLTAQQLARACDRQREHLKAQLAADKAHRGGVPLVRADHLPVPHGELRDVRGSLLLCPHMFELIAAAVEATTFEVSPGANRSSDLTILSRVVHLATLQVHAATGTNYFADAFAAEQPTPGSNGSLWHVQRGVGRQMLKALAAVWKGDALRDDVLYYQGLRWVLEQISSQSADGAALLAELGVELSEAATDAAAAGDTDINANKTDKSPAAKLALQKAAQQRALLEAKQRAAAAMAAFAAEMSDDTDEDDSDMDEAPIKGGDHASSVDSSAHGSSTHGHGSRADAAEDAGLECIVCREKKNAPLGYLCFLQPSNVFRNAHFSCPDCPELMNVFRVVSQSGCNVYAEASESAQVVATLTLGEHIVSENRDGRWLRVTAPVQGWCCLYSNSAGGGAVTVHLHPISDLQFAKHGGTRLHASVCGHTMHFDCWDMFYAANYARHENNARSPDLHAIEIDRGESLCPLCKSVTNTLLPHVPRSADVTMGPYLPAQAPTYRDGVAPVEKAVPSEGARSPLDWAREQSSLQVCQETIHSWFGRSLNRGRLSNDNNFYSTWEVQYRPSWDPAADDASVTRNVATLRRLHGLWSTTAYTLMTGVHNGLHERETSATELAIPVKLSDLDNTTLRHLIELAWRASAWMKHFNSFVSDPLSALFLGDATFPVDELTGKADIFFPPEQFLDSATATRADLERSLLSMPFEAFGGACYPNATTLRALGRLAMDKGLSEQDTWPLLKVPLLAQDLHVLAIAAVSSAENLAAFGAINQLLCVARLAQALLEPVATGLRTSAGCVKMSEGKGSTDLAYGVPVSGTKSEAKHSHPSDSAESASKRSKHVKEESIHSILSAAEALPLAPQGGGNEDESALLRLRDLLAAEAGVTLPSDAPHGAELLDIVLDSWIPYLEFSLHVQRTLSALSGVELPVPQAGILSGYPKTDHLSALRTQLQLPSLHELASRPFVREIVTAWAGHFRRYQEFICGGGEKSYFESDTVRWVPNKDAKTPVSSAKKSALKKKLESDMSYAASTARSEDRSANGSALETRMDEAATPVQRRQPDEHQPEEEEMYDALEGQSPQQEIVGVFADIPMDEEGVGVEAHGRSRGSSVASEAYFNVMEGEPSPGDDESDEEDGFDDEEGGEEEGEAEGAETEADALGAMAARFLEMADGLEGMPGNALADLLAGLTGTARSASDPLGGATLPAAARAVSWTLLGIYPINPTVDYPSPALHSLAQAVPRTQRASGLATFLQLLPRRTPLQGSLTGTHAIVGYNGDRLRHGFPDLSHFGVGMRHFKRCFVSLPSLYTDLYQMTKFPANEGKEKPPVVEDPALCLLCGRVLNAGNKAPDGMFEHRIGECTLHARSCGAGIGVFVLVQQCQVLLIRGARSVYWPSLYLDSSGEVNEQRGQNRPLFLSAKRYKKLEDLYLNHQIAKEIVRKRASAESVIRLSWF